MFSLSKIVKNILNELYISNYIAPNFRGSTWTYKDFINLTPDQRVSTYDQSKVDAGVERQLIDFAIDKIYEYYPEIVKNKKIKMMYLQIIMGKIYSGEVRDLVTLKSMIKKLKEIGIKVV